MEHTKTFVTSDHHFNHRNIIGLCGRPFVDDDGYPDVTQMNEVLIHNWNEVVGYSDQVFYLGDFCFGPLARIRDITDRLNGTKYLVRGNHDRHSRSAYLRSGFVEVSRSRDLTVGGVRILMAHKISDLSLTEYHMGLCGHVHEKWTTQEQHGKRVVNVGVDVHNFRPVDILDLVDAEETTHR